MRMLIINWTEGENDPFSYFSAQFRRELEVLGHEVHIVRLDGRTAASIATLHREAPVDLAFCWQGLGSRIGSGEGGTTIWEHLRIPVACLHADHPCYMPAHHEQTSDFHLHVYSAPAFVADANRLFPRDWPAIYLDFPNIFARRDEPVNFTGDFFVLPKNLTDIDLLRASWTQRYDPTTVRTLLDLSAHIVEAFCRGNRTSHQEVIWRYLPASLLAAATEDPINPLVADLIFCYMRELDRVHRNVAAAFVLETLPDTPIQIIGRGWERFREQRNPRHQFFAFEQVAHGAAQFGSNFGIFDIAPSCESLHDRCSRAMRSGTGFLISSSWKAGSAIHEDFQDLFFDGTPGRLESRVAAVRSDPERHRSRVRAFSAMYDALIPFGAFLEGVVAEMRRRGSMRAQD